MQHEPHAKGPKVAKQSHNHAPGVRMVAVKSQKPHRYYSLARFFGSAHLQSAVSQTCSLPGRESVPHTQVSQASSPLGGTQIENLRYSRLKICAAPMAVLGSLFLAGLALAQDKVTYTDQLLPLIQANCAKCHSSDKKKADLDLTSYQGLLKGSGSGMIVLSGDPGGSKLWKALTHAEEPFMPPNRPKLSDKELEVFKQWIIGGLLETSGSKAVAAAKSGLDLTLKPEALGKPDGPPPLPQECPIEPVIHTARMTAITGLAASPWAPLLAVAGEKQVLLYNTDTLELAGILPFTEGQITELKFSRSGKLLLAGGGVGAKSGRVVVWDVVTGEHLMTLGEEYDTVLAADMRPDQSQVALGGPSRLVKIYSTKTGELQHKIKKHTDWVTAVAYSPKGDVLATGDRNGGISLWDADTAQELFTLPGHKSAVTALSWRPDSKLLASSSEDGTIKLWETQDGRQVKSWTANSGGALCVSYSADGHLVSCGRDRAVTLWEGNGGKPRHCDFFGNMPIRVACSHDGARIFATDFDGRVGAWSAGDQKRLGELNSNPPPLNEQIAAAEARIQHVQERLAEAAKDVSAAEAEASKKVAALESAKAALQNACVARTNAEGELAKLTQAGTNAPADLQEKLLAATNAWQQAIAATSLAVQTRTKELEAAKTAVVNAKAALPQLELANAETALACLRSAHLLTEAYQAREVLNAKARENDKIVASLEANKKVLQQAEKALEEAKKSAATAEAQIQSAQSQLSKNEPGAKKLAQEVKSAKEHLQQLLEQYHSATAKPAELAKKGS